LLSRQEVELATEEIQMPADHNPASVAEGRISIDGGWDRLGELRQ
jgi:hypothetical protein